MDFRQLGIGPRRALVGGDGQIVFLLDYVLLPESLL